MVAGHGPMVAALWPAIAMVAALMVAGQIAMRDILGFYLDFESASTPSLGLGLP